MVLRLAALLQDVGLAAYLYVLLLTVLNIFLTFSVVVEVEVAVVEGAVVEGANTLKTIQYINSLSWLWL